MYKNRKEWARLHELISSGSRTIRGLARETGLGRDTLRKIGNFALPQPYTLGKRRVTKLDRYKPTIRRLLIEGASGSSHTGLSTVAIYRRLRAEQGFNGSYTIVKDHVRFLTVNDSAVRSSLEFREKSASKKATQSLLRQLGLDRSNQSQTHKLTDQKINLVWVLPEQKLSFYNLRRARDRDWMRSVIQNDIDQIEFRAALSGCADIPELLDRLYGAKLSDRNKAMVLLARHYGIPGQNIYRFLGITKGTYYRYVSKHRDGGLDMLFGRKPSPNWKFDKQDIKDAVFRVLHEPPSLYGINRTSWIMPDLSRVLGEMGKPAGRDVIRKITKQAGYKWRKARIQLTSKDPAYREKLANVQAILSKLGRDEAFFSIDEFGPFAVKMKQGRTLDPPGPHRVVPQWQKSKGCMIMTAALELSGNQVTHFYSEHKNTAEMIRMMDVLLGQYADRRTLYLSWDAASWHVSKKLLKRVEEHNGEAAALSLPRVEIAPLPAGAQFLNVIESIFSGMARAIIHNSDYPSAKAARGAIDRYFADRNQQFREKPKRAGNRIWGEERVLPAFSDSNNCKDRRWR